MTPEHPRIRASAQPRDPIRSVCIVVKRSIYQRFAVDENNPALNRVLRRKQAAARAMMRQHDRHLKAVHTVQETLKRFGMPFRTDARHATGRFDDFDLIITLGGDGTFLRTTHFASDKLLLPVNTDPVNSVGALCTVDVDRFTAKIRAVLAGDYTVKRLPLMRVSVNGKALPIAAVNDALFTNVSPAATSRYTLRVGKYREQQTSSGAWIATATGSTAAIGGAGGKRMQTGDRRLQFAVREPYHGNRTPYRLVQGYVDQGKKLTIVSAMVKAKIYLDGPTTAFDIHYADELELSLDRTVLRVVG